MITIDKPLVIHCNLLAHFKRANDDVEEKGLDCREKDERREIKIATKARRHEDIWPRISADKRGWA